MLYIILENPSAEMLEENLLKLRYLIEVVPDSLEFRIKILNREEKIIKVIEADKVREKNILFILIYFLDALGIYN